MATQTKVTEICPTTTQTWIQQGALLVDIRGRDEVAKLAFDVPNIINIPIDEFDERYKDLDFNSKIVVVGSDPLKCLLAAGYLVNHGYANVASMKHGLERWVQKGFPTKGDISEAGLNQSCCSSNSCC